MEIKVADMKVEYVDQSESEPLRLAYTAGFIEADGCFHVGNSVSVRITNKSLRVLKLFNDWWGGSIRSKGTPKDCYDWNLHGKDACALIVKLLPFLKIKSKEAELLLDYQGTIGAKGKGLSTDILLKRTLIKDTMKIARKERNLSV